MRCFLCSAAGPHTIVNGKDVVNFSSANYLGLVGHQKLLVRKWSHINNKFLLLGNDKPVNESICTLYCRTHVLLL